MRAERSRPVAGVVLAAGSSSRLGRNKLLLELGGQTLVRRAVHTALDGGLAPVLVVLGHEADRVRAALQGLRCKIVINSDYDAGVNGSVRLGIERVPTDAAAAVVMLADMPLVTAGMIRALVSRYRSSLAPLVISEYDGVHAPPMLYDRSLFDEFREFEGEGCGRHIVRRHRGEADVLPWPGERLADLDVPEDYDSLRVQFAEASP